MRAAYDAQKRDRRKCYVSLQLSPNRVRGTRSMAPGFGLLLSRSGTISVIVFVLLLLSPRSLLSDLLERLAFLP